MDVNYFFFNEVLVDATVQTSNFEKKQLPGAWLFRRPDW
jgi:hypothetical protein